MKSIVPQTGSDLAPFAGAGGRPSNDDEPGCIAELLTAPFTH